MDRRAFLGMAGAGLAAGLANQKATCGSAAARKSSLVPGIQYLSHDSKMDTRGYGRCYDCWVLQNNPDISREAHRVFDETKRRVFINGKPLENGVVPFENIAWMGITHGNCNLTIPTPNSTLFRWMRQPVTERQWSEMGCLARSIMSFPEYKWCLCHPTRHTSLIRLCTSGHSDQIDQYVEDVLGRFEGFVEDNFIGIRAKVIGC